MKISEVIGTAGGWLLAPWTGVVSGLRRARMFHPDGVVLRAELRARTADARENESTRARAALAQRLAGPALVRLSSALWRGGREWPDALGLALRLRRDDAVTAEPGPDDQDLLFATIKHPWTMPFAPLTTRQHDFLANDYFAVSPFDAPPLGRVRFRLARPHAVHEGGDRDARLSRALAEGTAAFTLEAAAVGGGRYAPLATLVLLERVLLDQTALRFDPHRAGRGVRPRGFVHALRIGAYAASQRARAATEPHGDR